MTKAISIHTMPDSSCAVRKPYRIWLTVDSDFGAIYVTEQSSAAPISGKWSFTDLISFVLHFGAVRAGLRTVAEVKK